MKRSYVKFVLGILLAPLLLLACIMIAMGEGEGEGKQSSAEDETAEVTHEALIVEPVCH